MSPEDFSVENREADSSPVQVPMTYSIRNELKPNPDVKLVFEGLMWFIFHGDTECQVAIHNSTRGTVLPHRHPHDLAINVWTIPDCDISRCGKPDPISIGDPKSIAGIQIDVNNPKERGVHVFQKDQGEFDRHNPNNDPYDWRWVLDFEKAPFYPEGIKLTSKKINPGIWINNGLFYTLHKTGSKFSLIPIGGGGRTYEIGNVPQYIGGNIYLQDQGDVTLTIRRAFPQQSESRVLKRTAGVCYQVDFTNVCLKNGKPCDFKPDHPTSVTERNDFYLYYDTCTKPSNKQRYALKRTDAAAPATETFCLEPAHKGHFESSNDAPCGPVAAGGGGGGG
jgi:hypothetical protein